VLASHTANIRAQEFENIVEIAMQKSRKPTIAG
jgi:hypothetical protein